MSTTDRRTRNARTIHASPAAVYRAFLDPALLARWMAPGTMTGHILNFDGRVGGTYRMSLTYDGTDAGQEGKSEGLTDTYEARFTELQPDRRIVQVVHFLTGKPEFQGAMTMTADLKPVPGGTELTLTFDDIPAGIRLEDNVAGTEASLDNLARLVE